MRSHPLLVIPLILTLSFGLLSAGCKGGGEEFRKILRGAANSVDKGSVKDNSKNTGKKKEKLALQNKNAIPKCPEHSVLRGAAYPESTAQWCEAVSKEGKALKHGEYRRWHKNGNLKIQAQYDLGKYSGEVKQWHINGRPKEVVHYKNGVRHGPATSWNRDGTKREMGSYFEGRKHGRFASWSRGGQLKEKGTFLNDERTGTWTSYHRDGQTKQIVNWKAGKKDGKTESYDKDGALLSVELYKDDLPHGKWESFYKSGKKKTEGTFVGGQKHGNWLVYNRNGATRKMIVYNKGAVVKNEGSKYARAASSQKQRTPFGSGDILGANPPPRRNTQIQPTAPTVPKSTQSAARSSWESL
jgi:antitoxin component YwqK of YwqJK toxin-antitoxin module